MCIRDRPWPTQRTWSDKVLAEFLHQGDMEALKGLPVSPNCDRNNTDQSMLSLNFIGHNAHGTDATTE